MRCTYIHVGHGEVPVAGQANRGSEMIGGDRLPGITIIKSKQKSIRDPRDRQSSQPTFYVTNRPPSCYNTFPHPPSRSLSPGSSCFFVLRRRHVLRTNNPRAKIHLLFIRSFFRNNDFDREIEYVLALCHSYCVCEFCDKKSCLYY